MNNAREPSPLRRVAASVSLVAAAGALVLTQLSEWQWLVLPWQIVAIAGGIAAAGIGLGRRSLHVQLASRAVAWLVSTFALLDAASSAFAGRFAVGEVAMVASSAAALFLARPMLETESAHRAFAPRRYRTWFSSGVVSSMATALAYAFLSIVSTCDNHLGAAIGFGALAAALLASAVGVLRMRAWGVVLAGSTAAIAALVGLALRDEVGLAVALAAVPGLLLTSPVLLARLGGERSATSSRGSHELSHIPVQAPANLRVADSGDAACAVEADEAFAHEGASPRLSAKALA